LIGEIMEEAAVICGECQAPMQLKNSKHGKFWGCTRWPQCNGTHGAHPDGKPMGTPANRETKQARIKAHAAFDGWWKKKGITRKQAYVHLRRILNISKDEAHIGRFDVEQCEKLVLLIGE
jgi:ssDNA-binding Zn-finger/Zn-ribbon topoisomerase 1